MKSNKKSKIPRDKWQWKHNNPKSMGGRKGSSKKEIYSNKILPQETRKITNKEPNHTTKASDRAETVGKTDRHSDHVKQS